MINEILDYYENEVYKKIKIKNEILYRILIIIGFVFLLISMIIYCYSLISNKKIIVIFSLSLNIAHVSVLAIASISISSFFCFRVVELLNEERYHFYSSFMRINNKKEIYTQVKKYKNEKINYFLRTNNINKNHQVSALTNNLYSKIKLQELKSVKNSSIFVFLFVVLLTTIFNKIYNELISHWSILIRSIVNNILGWTFLIIAALLALIYIDYSGNILLLEIKEIIFRKKYIIEIGLIEVLEEINLE